MVDGRGHLAAQKLAARSYTPPEVRAHFAAALADNPLVSIHNYSDIGHAFARPDAPSHAPQAADLANERSADFFRQNLVY